MSRTSSELDIKNSNFLKKDPAKTIGGIEFTSFCDGQSDGQTDQRTDGRTGKNNISLNPDVGGGGIIIIVHTYFELRVGHSYVREL